MASAAANNNYSNTVFEYNITNNSWAQKTSGATVRGYQKAIVYQNKMCLFGGQDNNYNALNDVWEYDLPHEVNIISSDLILNKSGKLGFSVTEALNNLNLFSTKTLDETGLVDGSIIQYNGEKFISFELLEQALTPDSWVQKTSGATARGGGSAIVYQDKMYIFGGYSNNFLNDVWEYNITNDSWTQKTSGATARAGGSVIVYQDKMYIFGGVNANGVLNDVWEYNITNDSWTQKTSGATIRDDHSVVVYQDKMYIFGGQDANGNDLNDVWEYDITNDSWTQKTSGATARTRPSAVVYQDKMYIFGGYDGNNDLNDIWEYDITNDSWTQKTSGALARDGNSAIVYQDKMYIFGGYNNGVLNDVWEYDITNDSWTQKTSGATARNDHSAVVYQNKMYIFGGNDGSNNLNDLWEYDIPAKNYLVPTNKIKDNQDINLADNAGTTASRPARSAASGIPFFDTTLGKPIWYDGTQWVDSTGTAV